MITVDYGLSSWYLLDGWYRVALEADVRGIARMIKKASQRKWVIDGMGRRLEGRMTILEAVMGHCRGKRGYFDWFVARFRRSLVVGSYWRITVMNDGGM